MKLSVSRLVLLASFAGSGCASSRTAQAPAPADPQLTEDLAEAELKEYHRHHHLGGATEFVAMSLDTLVAESAKTPKIEKVQDDLYACLAPAGEIENQLLLTLAEGVATGPMDRGKIDATIAELDTRAAGMHDCSVRALDELHAILSPGERETFADKVNAHWEVWQEVNQEVEGSADGQRGRLADLERQLILTDDQVKKILAALDVAFADLVGRFDPKETQAQMQKLTEGFASETFDAKSTMANADAHLATYGSMRKARFYETLAPLLTPTQRITLAGQLREYASQPSPTVSSN